MRSTKLLIHRFTVKATVLDTVEPFKVNKIYKEADQWKSYLVKRMMEIEEFRHDETQKMLRSLIKAHA